jgi:hypothetical protein
MINDVCGRVAYPGNGNSDEQGGFVLDLIHMAYSGWLRVSLLFGKPMAETNQESSLRSMKI